MHHTAIANKRVIRLEDARLEIRVEIRGIFSAMKQNVLKSARVLLAHPRVQRTREVARHRCTMSSKTSRDENNGETNSLATVQTIAVRLSSERAANADGHCENLGDARMVLNENILAFQRERRAEKHQCAAHFREQVSLGLVPALEDDVAETRKNVGVRSAGL